MTTKDVRNPLTPQNNRIPSTTFCFRWQSVSPKELKSPFPVQPSAHTQLQELDVGGVVEVKQAMALFVQIPVFGQMSTVKRGGGEAEKETVLGN